MIGPMSDDKSFIDVPCQSREVVHIECNHLECGRRPAHIKPESLARRYCLSKKINHAQSYRVLHGIVAIVIWKPLRLLFD